MSHFVGTGVHPNKRPRGSERGRRGRPMHPPELRRGMGPGAPKARTTKSYRKLEKRGCRDSGTPPLPAAPGPFSAKAFAGGSAWTRPSISILLGS